MSRSVPLWIGRSDDEAVPLRVRDAVADELGKYEERLLAKLNREQQRGCWIWTGAHCPDGYGHMKVGAKYEKVHRLSYRLYVGEIPPGAHMCHRCDTPACCNPLHLWPGTPRENVLDAKTKGRLRNGVTRGEANHASKLSAAEVATIRAAPKVYGSGRRLAAQYGVREATICEIRAGRSWRAR